MVDEVEPRRRRELSGVGRDVWDRRVEVAVVPSLSLEVVVPTYIGMAYVVMAYIVMAYIVKWP